MYRHRCSRRAQQTYHGVLAPASSWRDEVVVQRPSKDAKREKEPPRPPHRYLWADLMQRVFAIDVLQCKFCKGKRRLVSLITERSVIVRIPTVRRCRTSRGSAARRS